MISHTAGSIPENPCCWLSPPSAWLCGFGQFLQHFRYLVEWRNCIRWAQTSVTVRETLKHEYSGNHVKETTSKAFIVFHDFNCIHKTFLRCPAWLKCHLLDEIWLVILLKTVMCPHLALLVSLPSCISLQNTFHLLTRKSLVYYAFICLSLQTNICFTWAKIFVLIIGIYQMPRIVHNIWYVLDIVE